MAEDKTPRSSGDDATASAKMRAALRAALEGHDPVLGAFVPRFIGVFILITAIAVAVETIKGLPEWVMLALFLFETVAVVVFLSEYVLRLFAAEKPWRYATSFWGIVDLFSFLPTLLFLGFDALGLRALRLLRLLRLLKLVKNDNSYRRLVVSVRRVREELIAVVVAAGIVLYLASVGIYYFEHSVQPEAFASIPESMWWAIATLTTVGYGDVVPITTGGRIFTGFIMLIGIGIIAVPTGLIASALMAARRHRDDRERLASSFAEQVADKIVADMEEFPGDPPEPSQPDGAAQSQKRR
ncbi:MAG: ion transporter [Pseudomonadota bacterium]